MSNKSIPENISGVHIHFVGIKGTGMAALVEILHNKGAIITGSDVEDRFYTDEILEKLGIKALPFSGDNITNDIQFVIYSSAYKLDKNPDLISAGKKNVPCLLYTEALGSYSSRAYSCGVSGVHGKTSTTGLVVSILKEIDLPAQVLAGSVINSFGGTSTYTSPLVKNKVNPVGEPGDDGVGTGLVDVVSGCDSEVSKRENQTIFVAETCEYQRHFMSFCPQKIILTTVEPDHEDYYPTYEDIRSAFVDYVCKLPIGGEVIYCADDPGAVDTIQLVAGNRPDIIAVPYGKKAKGDYKLTFGNVENEENKFSLALFEDLGQYFSGEFCLKMPGKHEVLDAAAAVALVCQLLREFGKNPVEYAGAIYKGLKSFSGGKRRSEIVGSFTNKNGDDVLVIDDYGHHPTAVQTTLEGFKEFYKGRKLIVDFMSHTYSRTQALLKDFGASFYSADGVILHKIYSSARENPKDFNITGRTLFEEVLKNGKENVVYYEEIIDALPYAVEELNKPLDKSLYPDGYLFVTMGAGDNWKLGKAVLDEMKK